MHKGSLDLDTISSRLQKLEKQNTAFKRLGITFLVGISSLMLTGLAKPGNRIVEAEAFILKDSQGAVHGGLRIAPDGSSHLDLLAGREKAMFMLLAQPDGRQALAISDANGDPRVILALDSEGHGYIALNGAGGKPRAVLESSDENSSLVLDGGGGYQAAITSGSQGSATAGLAIMPTSWKGIPLARLTVELDGTPRCQLRSEGGEVLFDKP